GDGRDEGQRRLVDLTVEERHAEARLPGPGQQRRRGDLDVVGESGGVGTEGRRGGEERRLQPGGQVSGRRRADRHVPGQGLGDGQNEAAETGESRGHRPGIGAGGGGRVAVGGASGPDAVGGQRRSGGVGGGGEGRLDGGGSGDGRAGRAHAVSFESAEAVMTQARRLPRRPGRASKRGTPPTATSRGWSTGWARGSTSPGRRSTMSERPSTTGRKLTLTETGAAAIRWARASRTDSASDATRPARRKLPLTSSRTGWRAAKGIHSVADPSWAPIRRS